MIQLWDPWVRLFHWSLAGIVFLNHFLVEGRVWHDWLGYAGCGLVAWRAAWALAERSPYSKHHKRGAAIVMVAMLVSVLLLGLSGWMMSWDRFWGEGWLEDTHEGISYFLMGLVVIHVAGIVRECVVRRENLVAQMIHGKKVRPRPQARGRKIAND